MKNSIKKFVLACAAVTAITAVSATAMAADLGDVYDATANSVAVTLPVGIDTTKEATVLVLNAGKSLTDTLTDADILYVNQATGGDFDGAATAEAETLKLLSQGVEEDGTTLKSLADGTYTVAIGYYNTDGAFTIQEGTFTLGASSTHEVLLGDVTLDGQIQVTDAQQVARHIAKSTDWSETPDKLIAANVTKGDTDINVTDAQQIARYIAKGTTTTNVGKTAVVDDATGEVVEVK
jgi:hypothetical protein